MERAIPHVSNLRAALKISRNTLIAAGAFSAVANLLLLVPALFMLQVYDRVLTSRNELTLILLFSLAVGAYLLLAAVDLCRNLILTRIGARFDMSLNQTVFTKEFQTRLVSGTTDGASVLQDLAQLRECLAGRPMWALLDLPWFPVYLLVIFIFEPVLGWLAIVSTALFCGLGVLNERMTRPATIAARSAQGRTSYIAASAFRNADVIQAMGGLSSTWKRWLSSYRQYLLLQAQVNDRTAIVGALTKFSQLVTQSIVLAAACVLVIENRITPGMMIAASILMSRTLSPVQQIISSWRAWSNVFEARCRLRELLMIEALPELHIDPHRLLGLLKVNDVGVVAPGTGKQILRNISFGLAPGDALAVIGPSGTGKSTLARTLAGLVPITSGNIRMNGIDCCNHDRVQFGLSIGYLPQNVTLMQGTIADNISGFDEQGLERAILAAKFAGVDQMIMTLPMGYQTQVGEAGVLSGGQRQRVALARALYGNPAILILDEPNANLDDEGRNQLLNTIVKLRNEQKIVIVITHGRGVLSAVSHMLVLVMDGPSRFGAAHGIQAARSRSQLPPNRPKHVSAPSKDGFTAQAATLLSGSKDE